MASPITNEVVVEFSAQSVQPGVDARFLCAALLAQSRINADNKAHVEAVVNELVILASLTIV